MAIGAEDAAVPKAIRQNPVLSAMQALWI